MLKNGYAFRHRPVYKEMATLLPLDDEALPKGGQLIKERLCHWGTKLVYLSVNPQCEGGKIQLAELLRLKFYLYLIKPIKIEETKLNVLSCKF